MGKLEDMKKEKVHTRHITLETYATDNDDIIIEGELLDHRLKEIFHLTGGKRSPGVVHHMKIRLLVGPPGFTIKDVEVEMPGIPRDECAETMESIQQVKGMSISTGYTARVKNLLGGKAGCAHLTMLLIAMGPEAVQGFFANFARNPIPDDAKEVMALGMKNTCKVWREDGPVFKSLVQP